SSERLGRLLAGDLPAGEQAPLAAHLAGCLRGQGQVEQLLADDSVLTWRRAAGDRTDPGPPDGLMDSMRRLGPPVGPSSGALAHPDGGPAADAPCDDPETCPERIGAYQILGLLGRGGMSVVYKARQPGLGRVVALKVLRFRGPSSPLDVARFFREAATVA